MGARVEMPTLSDDDVALLMLLAEGMPIEESSRAYRLPHFMKS